MSVLLEQLAKEGEVPLERYGHQVGGRQLLFKYKDTICKPLIAREHFFYETAPETIRRYIPCYYGVISVSYVKQPSGEIQAIASLKEHRPPLLPSVKPDKQFPKCTTGITLHSEGISIASAKLVNGDEYINPWATMCSEKLNKGLKEMDDGLQNFNKDYVILENLTTKFQAPSVLDLKVGTNKEASSAPSFMVRMAGMQKFDAVKNQYTFYDKYFGKQFSEDEFSQVLRSFLNNGACFRSDLLVTVSRMLKDLKASIRTTPSFRYFSSSLLLIYDGAECPEDLCKRKTEAKSVNCKTDIKRDATTSDLNVNATPTSTECVTPTSTGLDLNAMPTSNTEATPTSTCNGYLNYFPLSTSINRTCSQSPNHLVTCNGAPPIQCPLPENHIKGVALSKMTPSLMSTSELAEARCHFDLRMIDFARSTHPSYHDQIGYNGLDECYLSGLDFLIGIFQKMMDGTYFSDMRNFDETTKLLS